MYELTKLKDIISDNRIRKQLFKNGFRTPESLIFIEKFKDKLRGKIPFFPEDINEIKYINSLIISTGCRSLDDMLGGGVETGAVTEFVGEFGTGKTQICHQLSVTVQLPADMGGLEAGAIYIDTEGTFRPERIIQIASYRGIEPKKALKNIIYLRIKPQQSIRNIAKLINAITSKINVRIVLIDSLPLLVSVKNMALRPYKLASLIHLLKNIAIKNNFACVYTNRVTSRMERNMALSDPYISIAVDRRIRLIKVGRSIIRAELSLHYNTMLHSATFRITEDGIVKW